MKPYGYVYLITNQVNGKAYVGQTVRTVAGRWAHHKHGAIKKGRNRRFPNAIRKYGPDAFIVSTLHEARDKGELDALEIQEIASRASTDSKFGYNMTDGANNGVNSEESRKKISLSKLGIPKSLECRRKLSEANLGKPMLQVTKDALLVANTGRERTPEYRELMRVKSTGRKHSPATVAKIREASKGRIPVLSDEVRAARRSSMLGNTRSLGVVPSIETRIKLSQARSGERNAFFGKKHSDETRARMRGKRKPRIARVEG